MTDRIERVVERLELLNEICMVNGLSQLAYRLFLDGRQVHITADNALMMLQMWQYIQTMEGLQCHFVDNEILCSDFKVDEFGDFQKGLRL